MFNKKKSNVNTYGIVGLGRFGLALALELLNNQNSDILVLDKDEEKISEMRDYTENAFVVKNLDKKSLLDTGIQNCDIAIVCISEHMDISILTTLHLVSLGIPKVIAKASSHEHGEILEKLGAEVVYPERDMAHRLAHRLEASRMLDFVSLSEKLNISKIICPEKIFNMTVQEVNIRREFGVNIVAIESGSTLIESVSPTYIFKKGDMLFLSGNKEALNKISNWASSET